MTFRWVLRVVLLLGGYVCLQAQTNDRRKLEVPGVGSQVSPAKPDAVPSKRPGIKGLNVPDEPEHPTPATDFHDAKYGLGFHVPAGWNFERRDGLLSNFGVDVRTTRRNLDVRGVAAINFNPYPASTFAGATFYYSVLPVADAAGCAAQATTGNLKAQKDVRIAGVPFKHGEDHHGVVCTESRDEVFTAMQGRACLRFDLVVNTFCSQTSGAMEISREQLADVDGRLAGILGSIVVERK